jgi:hypothetical protein
MLNMFFSSVYIQVENYIPGWKGQLSAFLIGPFKKFSKNVLILNDLVCFTGFIYGHTQQKDFILVPTQ